MTITTTDVEITCTPADGIFTVSADTIAALDALAQTLTSHEHWEADVTIGWTPADTTHLTARPRHDQETTTA